MIVFAAKVAFERRSRAFGRVLPRRLADQICLCIIISSTLVPCTSMSKLQTQQSSGSVSTAAGRPASL